MSDVAPLIVSLIAMLWFASAWRLVIVRDERPVNALFGAGLSFRRGRAILISIVIAAIGVLISASSLQTAVLNGYPGDSLFTLDPAEIAGVVLISLTLITSFFWLLSLILLPLARAVAARPVTRVAAAIVSLAGALLVFGMSHTVSPQIYYTFYRWIIPGLPDQWVIKTWLDTERLIGAAALAPGGTLSAHLTGVTIWCVAVFVVWIFMMRWRDGAWQASPLVAGMISSAMLFLIRLAVS